MKKTLLVILVLVFNFYTSQADENLEIGKRKQALRGKALELAPMLVRAYAEHRAGLEMSSPYSTAGVYSSPLTTRGMGLGGGIMTDIYLDREEDSINDIDLRAAVHPKANPRGRTDELGTAELRELIERGSNIALKSKIYEETRTHIKRLERSILALEALDAEKPSEEAHDAIIAQLTTEREQKMAQLKGIKRDLNQLKNEQRKQRRKMNFDWYEFSSNKDIVSVANQNGFRCGEKERYVSLGAPRHDKYLENVACIDKNGFISKYLPYLDLENQVFSNIHSIERDAKTREVSSVSVSYTGDGGAFNTVKIRRSGNALITEELNAKGEVISFKAHSQDWSTGLPENVLPLGRSAPAESGEPRPAQRANTTN